MQRVLGRASLRVVEWFADLDVDWLPVMDRTGLVTPLPLLALARVLGDSETFVCVSIQTVDLSIDSSIQTWRARVAWHWR